jgi:hypothetical protein
MLCALAFLTLASCGPARSARTPGTDQTGGSGGDDSSGGSGPDTTGGSGGSSTGGSGGTPGTGGVGGRRSIGGSGGADTGGTGGNDTGGAGGDVRDAAPPVDATVPVDVAGRTDAAPADMGVKDTASHGDAPKGPPDPGDSPFPPGPAPIGAGWTEVAAPYLVDHPPNQTRYTEDNGKWHMWLFNDDVSTFPGRDAGPRSEVHWKYSYTAGQAQFQGDFYIADNCAHASVIQIFGAADVSTAAMFWAMPDSLAYYGRTPPVYSPAWNHFFRLNLTHDTATRQIDIYVDGQKKASFTDHGAASHYFKSGIYHQPNMTPRCDVYMQNIHIFKK